MARALRFSFAVLAVFAIVGLATAAVVPGHDHTSSHECVVCQASHLPCLTPTIVVALEAPVRVVWEFAPVVSIRVFESQRVATPPRAPPV